MRSKTGVNLLQKAVQADVNGDHKKARELEAEANIYLTPADKVEMGAGIEGYKCLGCVSNLTISNDIPQFLVFYDRSS